MAKSKPKSRLQRQKDNPCGKYWRNKADKLWGEIIRKRAKCRCEWCGKMTNRIEAHHFRARTNIHFRHHLANGIGLCFVCHHEVHQDGASQIRFFEYLKQKMKNSYALLSLKDKYEGEKVNYQEKYEYLKSLRD